MHTYHCTLNGNDLTDTLRQGKYKAPTNAKKKADGSYSYATDKTAEELYPKLNAAAGTNFFDSKKHWMSLLVRGSDPFTIKTSPKVCTWWNPILQATPKVLSLYRYQYTPFIADYIQAWCTGNCRLYSKIVLSLTLESVDGSDFFDEDKIIENLAALLDVPKDKIKIAKIVAEGNLR